MEKTKELEGRYYQPTQYCDDGTNIDWGLPIELHSFEVFHTKEGCEEWCIDNGYDLGDMVITEYSGDDIEGCVYLDD